MEFMGENSGVMILQSVIILLAIIILFVLYSDRSTATELQNKIDNFKCPELPEIPECPDCNCDSEGCPDCNCDIPTALDCPDCPACPEHSSPSVDDIVNAIFPGRNQGVTSHGNYFPLDGLGEADVEPAYSPVTNLMPNYVGGDGGPSAISFADQTLLGEGSDIALATTRQPALSTTQGVFTEPSAVDGGTPATPSPPATPVSSPTPSSDVTNEPDDDQDDDQDDEEEGGLLSSIL